MPIIPADTNGNWRTLPDLISIMLFPQDEQKRNECACTLEWRRKLDGMTDNERAVLPKQDIEAIVSAPSFSQLMEVMARKAAVGQIAGELLLLALQLDASGMGGSLRKARFLVSHHNSIINESQGMKLWASVSSMKNAWKEYQTVAHLWAALKILLDANPEEFDDVDETVGIEKILDTLSRIPVERFASTSTWALEKAAGLIASHQTSNGRPLLNIDTAWTFPNTVVADQFAAPVRDLPIWCGGALTEYLRGQI